MVTSIQLSEKTKEKLSRLKKNESYEKVIERLIKDNEKYLIAEDMKEYEANHSKESLEELKEWESVDLDW